MHCNVPAAHSSLCAGELREGDVVQVFLESAGTPEGDFLVSGVQVRGWEWVTGSPLN